ncbi:hypothetical protein B0T26DRAFT_776233 [Lasiosphaeria miniovina]|uniref:Uncharacterized protein n=1 Tax=Lasiosphaeria miniovina TaxID=1954250 RepID=A0AA40DV85_9PEZI|nr:uncharacterized protein B0T26DRAFT_776233 [Lasiosphaeria miniovina]KAK0717619.1 hypothetical protein B0T26DRAFT_776233 [Lasiosphaeria miniovina]
MKPITFADATPARLKDTLLLFNLKSAAVHYLYELLSRNGSGCIRSAGGIALPNELWFKVLELLAHDASRPHQPFCFVKASLVPSGSFGGAEKILRCVRHDFDLAPGQRLAGNLQNRRTEELLLGMTLKEHETWFPMYYNRPCVMIPNLIERSGPNNIFYVSLRAGTSLGPDLSRTMVVLHRRLFTNSNSVPPSDFKRQGTLLKRRLKELGYGSG